MNDQEFENLLNQYCDETIDQQNAEALEEELLKNSERRDLFNRYMNLDASLKEQAETEPDPTLSQSPKRSFPLMAIVISMLLGLNIIIAIIPSPPKSTDKNQPVDLKGEPLQTGVGIVTKSIKLRDASANLISGRILESGTFSFTAGTLHLEMFSGVNILITGPAHFSLANSMNISIKTGKARFMIPKPAQGFKITTETEEIETPGGEFSLKIQKDDSYIHVYKGSVTLYSSKSGTPAKAINSKQGYNFNTQELSTFNELSSALSFEKAQALKVIIEKKRFLNWKEFSLKTAQRNDVLLYYTFQNEMPYSRTIQNSSSQDGLDGSIVGSQWTQGRWPDKKALNFSSTGDRIRLNIPGEYDAMTFSCWVKIRSFDRWLSSLLLTEDYNRGELHWQLSDSGEIILGANRNGNAFSPAVINEQDLGRWLHLATVYDPQKLAISHYLDGKKVYEQKLKKAYKIKMGKSDIGNWTSSATSHRIRSFNGVMDEFIIFSSPLSDQEIKNIYSLGKPN